MKSLASRSTEKVLFRNFLFMVLLQGANYLLPLVTVPYIARTLSVENFGLINYSQAFIGYTTLFINFGFDYTATREVAANRGNTQKISTVFSTTISAKVLLFALTLLVYFPVIYTIPKFTAHADVYLITFLVNIGIILMPSWLYQGMERLSYIALFSFGIRIIFTGLIFLLVKSNADYLYIPLSTAIGQFLVGVVSFILAIKLFNLKPYVAKLKAVVSSLREGLPIFASTVAVNLYTTTNLVVLGFMVSDTVVGYYAASSKLILIFVSAVMFPVGLTLFPFIGKKLSISHQSGMNALRKATYLVGGATFILSCGILLLSDYIITLIYGAQFTAAADSLRILAFLPFVIGLNNIFGTQGVLNLKMDKIFLMITTTGAVTSVALNLILVPILAEKGTALAWLVTEVFITVSFFITLRRKGFRLLKSRV
ncbi:flippase [Pontibacter oryzae]|uniref:flippase n=1 Tax=Pontibacter oryzae TaxID=2304593 RepID=UPI0021CF26DC|nr:flippase [Pontibacter oryzae]